MSTDAATGRVPALTIGWRLQMALNHGGVSHQQMADLLGVNRATISRWCNDRGAPPRTIYLRQWALACGVDADWLITGRGHNDSDPRPGRVSDQDEGDVRHEGLEPPTRWLMPDAWSEGHDGARVFPFRHPGAEPGAAA